MLSSKPSNPVLRAWKAAEPTITRDDRKQQRGFTPTLKPGVLDVRMALWEMRRK